MKRVRYTADALRDLKRHGNMARRIKAAVLEHAEGHGAHANNVRRLVGAATCRLRVGDYRAIFTEDESEIVVSQVGPRGGVYD